MVAKSNVIRIQSGILKGRTLEFPSRPGLRPATGEMRETLFNWIRPELAGGRILDAFAGSGAMSFEALSQGAEFVQAHEIDPDAFVCLEKNLKKMPQELKLSLSPKDFRHTWLSDNHFDFIFLDPPYESSLIDESLNFLYTHITIETKVFIHHPITRQVNLTNWEVLKHKKRNKRIYSLLQLPPKRLKN